jgi:hypothetical protein
MFRIVTVVFFLSLLPLGVSAHHSVGAFFDLSTPVEIEGKVVSLRWKNPHVSMTIEQTTADGGVDAWQVTSGGPTLLRRFGVTDGIVAIGDTVSMSGFPSRVGRQEMLGVSIRLADDRSIPMFPSPLAMQFGHKLKSGAHITAEAAGEDAQSAQGIFRVWSYGRTMNRPVVEPAFTQKALAGQALYDPLVDDPALYCIPQGMPNRMDSPFPIEFTDRGDQIVLGFEAWDIKLGQQVERVIHMAGDQNAATHRGTPLGYSVGYWEDNALVVTTSDIDWDIFDDLGTPQSNLITTVERFTLSEEEDRLDYQVVVTDPEILLEPLVITWHWNWVPGESLEVMPYECPVVE